MSDNDENMILNNGPWGGNGSGGGNNGGGNGGDKNPWGQRPSGGNNGDPDLDAVLRQAQDKFKNAFGDRRNGGGGNFGGGHFAGMPPHKLVGLGILAITALWLSTGFYRVLPEEDAVILTLGKWTSTRDAAGLGYVLPYPFQEIVKVDVEQDRRLAVGFEGDRDRPEESLMLTGDENIIDIDFVVLWKVADAGKYLFEIRDPETTVKKVAESAMREIIGRTLIQKALTEARGDVEIKTKDLMQKMLDEYQSGVVINAVQLQKVNPPTQVVDAFDDVQRARTDLERLKNEAETYRNDIVPRARGDAQKLLQDADAYKQAVLSKAEGEAGRFASIYKAYAESKDVTQKRIYIETMQEIMQNSKKVIVGDGKSAPLLPYLPLDQLKK